MNTLVVQGRGVAKPADFTPQSKRQYFCDIVQGDVSNDVRVENSLSVAAGTWAPTGSIVYADKAVAIPGAGPSSATGINITVPQIVTVGTENGNVTSEFGNSGCGLVTSVPLDAKNVILTTVYDASATYTVGGALTVKKITLNGKEVYAVAPAAAKTDLIVGIVEAVPAMTHYEVKGILFKAYFQPKAA